MCLKGVQMPWTHSHVRDASAYDGTHLPFSALRRMARNRALSARLPIMLRLSSRLA